MRYINGKITTIVAKIADHHVIVSFRPNISNTQAPIIRFGPSRHKSKYPTTVDCGIIYATDAYSANLTVVDTATAEMCGQVIYPASVLNISKNAVEAQAFLDYMMNDASDAIFEKVGFTPINE